MRNPLRLFTILLLSISPLSIEAQQILVLGVKQPASCRFATRPLIADLETTPYPKDWTIVVACTRLAWEQLQRKADAMQTNTGFTNLQKRITAINGEIYRETLPLREAARRSPGLVLQHELGHILCQCNRESDADRAARGKFGMLAGIVSPAGTVRQQSTLGLVVLP